MKRKSLKAVLKHVTEWLDKHSLFSVLGLLRVNNYPWFWARFRARSIDGVRLISEIRVKNAQQAALIDAQLDDVAKKREEIDRKLRLIEAPYVSAVDVDGEGSAPFKLTADKALEAVQTLSPNENNNNNE